MSIDRRKYFIGDMLAGIYSIIRDVLSHVDVLQQPELRTFYIDILKKISLAMRTLNFKKHELISVIDEVYGVSEDDLSRDIDKSYEDAMRYAEALRSINPPEQRIEGLSKRDPVRELLIELGVVNELDQPTPTFMALRGAIRMMVRDEEELFNNVDLIDAYAVQTIINIYRRTREVSDEVLADLWARICSKMKVSYDEMFEMLTKIDEYIKGKFRAEPHSLVM